MHFGHLCVSQQSALDEQLKVDQEEPIETGRDAQQPEPEDVLNREPVEGLDGQDLDELEQGGDKLEEA